MKLIHLKNLKHECVLVELPEGHTLEDYVSETDEIGLPNLLGKFTDLKEEDFEGVVHTDEVYDPIRFPWGEGIVYKNYNSHTWGWSAKESFISAIEAEGWYIDINHTRHVEPDFNEAQEKVINLSNCYLFVKS